MHMTLYYRIEKILEALDAWFPRRHWPSLECLVLKLLNLD
jgi:hypothetical protein